MAKKAAEYRLMPHKKLGVEMKGKTLQIGTHGLIEQRASANRPMMALGVGSRVVLDPEPLVLDP